MSIERRITTFPLVPLFTPSGSAAYTTMSAPAGLAALGNSSYGYISPTTSAILIVPFEYGLPQLHHQNQAILYWYLNALPSSATYIDVTPIAIENFFYTPANIYNPGQNDGSFTYIRAFKAQFDDLDVANDRVNPKNYTIRKTAADPTITINAVQPVRFGTRHPFPICDPYVGLLVQHDGIYTAGRQIMAAMLVLGEA